jgi:putative membrane protein
MVGRVALAVALAGAAQAAGAGAQTPIPPSTPDFALAAVQSNQYEIGAAELARAQSKDPRIQAFAEQMIEDHGRANQSLLQAVTASGLTPPPPAMSSDQASLLAALQSLRGRDFDKTYAKQQVLAHSQALAVEQSYAASGADANLRKAAQADVPMIRHHLEAAQQIASTFGGP